MSDMTDSEQIAGLIATVSALRDEVHALRQDLNDQRDNFVPSREFTAWKTSLAREFIAWKTSLDREIVDTKATHQRDIAEVKGAIDREVADRKASKAPWWSVAAAVIAGLGLALTVVLNLKPNP